VRLVAGFFVLILLTTLSAGVPAYLVIRTQLERQAWANVDNTRQATLSLLDVERQQLADLAEVLAERPTLRTLLIGQTSEALPAYLDAFQRQSNLDIVSICVEGRLLVGEPIEAACLDATGFELTGGRPVLLASRPVFDERRGLLATVTIGQWLDDTFLSQLAANTGVEHSILRPDGERLASSIPSTLEATLVRALADPPGGQVLDVGERRYYTASSSLLDSSDETILLSEVALAVDGLLAAERRALSILALSTGVVALLGTLLGFWYVRQLVAPLQKLTDVAGQISEGDLMARIPEIHRPAEISTLATALQQSQASMLHAIEERSQARDWLDTLIQSIVEGVVTFDAAGRVTFLSQGAETMTGWRREKALGLHINKLFPVTGRWEGTFLDALPSPGEKRQITVRTRDGRTTTLAITGARLAPPGEATMQTALVLRDVTQEEALRHLRSYFLANITHEFRTPLSALNASIELLLEEVDDMSAAEIRQLLKSTNLSLRGLQNLIDNLLESSTIEAGRFVLQRRPMNLNQVIHDALRVVQPLLDRRQQQVIVEEMDQFDEISADPGRLTQALVNLLTNASKYSPIGRPIDLHVEKRDNVLRVSVADRGPGIPLEERVNVFRRFVRLNDAGGEQYGIGLGLFVVRTTIEAHGGRVGADGRPGGGSIFWFELPLIQRVSL
jgi:PAS domain S-box-containing protein